MTAARANLLDQRRLTTTATAVFTVDQVKTEITRIILCNTTGSATTFTIHHDDTGSAGFTVSNALYSGAAIGANETITIEAQSESTGITLQAGGRLAFEAGAADSLTVSIYGIGLDVKRGVGR